MSAVNYLQQQLKELQRSPTCGFRVEVDEKNMFLWTVWIAGPADSPLQGGQFRAQLTFPKDFPFNPPKMVFKSTMWHPNVYHPSGEVCVSILHPPSEDEFGYESATERWNPIRSIESVIISVIAMLADPNPESPANVDAAAQWRNDRESFNK